MIDAAQLLTDTKAQVKALIDGLRASVAGGGDNAAVVDREYDAARAAGRTGLAKGEWGEGLYAQAAVAWVLGCVFVRFCEDNDLVPEPLLGGPGPRRAIALEHRSAHLQANPAHDDRHWLREVFGQYQSLPATGDVFGAHNPMWLLTPSADGARHLLQAFQDIDPDSGEIRHDFTDPAWDTRFLGDLYQDLSEHAKKTYALLQTPIFVEEFILDRTLEPALATFGLRDTTVIDPTCGSGHFLLGSFDRLFQRWADNEPGTNRRELAQRALDAIGGVDLNPFAAAIARFRLLVAALRAGGDSRLTDAPGYRLHIAVGDSLLHGDAPGALPGMSSADEQAAASHGYASEDHDLARDLLTRQWHAVVGNPPYIRPVDPVIRALYKKRFAACGGKFTLSVPFTELFWALARAADSHSERAGFIGLINANAFMKAAFGRRLVTQWFPTHDVTHIVDTSGAYIPGHGTPTALLFGRAQAPRGATVRVLMSIRGEPDAPKDPSKGLVWREICEAIDSPTFTGQFVSSADMSRGRLQEHPWSIGGGGAAELKDWLDETNPVRVSDFVTVGISVVLGEEEPFVRRNRSEWARVGVRSDETRTLLRGEDVRDWLSQSAATCVLFPYSADGLLRPLSLAAGRAMWPFRTNLNGYRFYGETRSERGLAWYQYGALMRERLSAPFSAAISYKVTHNHVAPIDPQALAKQTAPVLTLKPGRPAEDLPRLLAAFNSSTALFWLKQVCRNVGDSTDSSGARVSGVEAWIDTYQYDGSSLEALPLPTDISPDTASELIRLALRSDGIFHPPPEGVTLAWLHETGRRWDALRRQMIAAQERLDWEAYRLYGLVDEDLTTGDEPEPPLQLGERAFEIVLARQMAAGAEVSSWFVRHGSTPITELPSHWPEWYQRLVDRRIDLIEMNLSIGLIERPEHKRRWAAKPGDEQAKGALKTWLLDRLEERRYWPEPGAITTTARLAAEARTDAEFMQVAPLYAGREDVDVAVLVTDLIKGEAVPYLAALRYTDSGLRKHVQWLDTWDIQRREDAGGVVGDTPVPPKYARADFTPGSWEHRGKLDVPKERFIAYPGAERETDASLPVGWAGWDHLARARALATWYLQAKREGRDLAHLTPLLAGLAELVPWLHQWYDDPNPDPALDRPGSQIAALVDAELRFHHLTSADLSAWRPLPARRGRRRS